MWCRRTEKGHNELNISDLHVLARSGDKTAETELFVRLSERFHAFAHHRVWNKDDAMELVQDALSVIAQEYRQLEVETSFLAWAYKVLDNRILAYIKRRKAGRVVSQDDTAQAPAGETDLELRRRLQDCLVKVIRVNRRYGRMLNLGYQGFTITEICSRLQVTRNNAYVILSRARSLLELCLMKGRIE